MKAIRFVAITYLALTAMLAFICLIDLLNTEPLHKGNWTGIVATHSSINFVFIIWFLSMVSAFAIIINTDHKK